VSNLGHSPKFKKDASMAAPRRNVIIEPPTLKIIKSEFTPNFTFNVENKVPLPERKRSGKAFKSKYPFAQMAVGDSFFVPNGKLSTIVSTVHIWNKRIRKANNTYAKFICREVDGGVRVWRKT